METDEDNHTSSNIASNEIDKDTAQKLRGDAIGDTMYSEVFVLNTIMQFSDLKWSPEVEENLCFLWDMTEEKDVCDYLLQIKFPTLACSALSNYNEPRFVEIVIGIFANVLCAKCEKSISDEEVKTVVNFLISNDPYILIQVMRFIHAVAFITDKLDFITSEHMDRINFILYNSTNKELLVHSMKTLSSITDGTKLDPGVLKGELLQSAMAACRTVKQGTLENSDFEITKSEEQHIVTKHLIQFMCNVCSYIDGFKLTQLANELKVYSGEFCNEMESLMAYFALDKNLIPVDDEFKFYVEAIVYVYRILGVGYSSAMVVLLGKILLILYKKDSDSVGLCAELFCYFLSVGELSSLECDLRNVAEAKCFLADIEKRSFEFEFSYLDKLKSVVNKL